MTITNDIRYIGVNDHDVDLFEEEGYYFDDFGDTIRLKDGKNATAAKRAEFEAQKSKGPDNVKGTYDDGLPATYDQFIELCDIISAKNIGTKPVEFVEYHVLFLNENGEVIRTAWGYLTDDDSEIKPGATEMREESAYDTFADVRVLALGRIDD